MGYYECSSSHHQFIQCVLYYLFAFCIQRGSSFIKHKDLRILQNGTGNGNTLTLSAGKDNPPVTGHGFQSLRKILNEIFRIGRPDGFPDFFFCSIQTSIQDVIPDSCVKQHSILRYHPDKVTKRAQGYVPDIHTIDAYGTAGNIIETGKDIGHCGLPRARRSYQGNGFPWISRKVKIGKYRMSLYIVKGYMVKLYYPLGNLQIWRIWLFHNFRLGIQNGKYTVSSSQGFLNVTYSFRHTFYRIGQIDGVHKEGNQFPAGHNAINDGYPSVPDNGCYRKGREKFHKRSHLALLPDGPYRSLEIGFIHLIKPLDFKIRTVKTADNPDTLNSFLQHGCYISQPFLHGTPAVVQLSSKETNRTGNQRNNDQAQYSQFPLKINHGHKGADKYGAFLYKGHKIIYNGRLQSRYIIGKITHDFTGSSAVIICH